MYAVPKMTHYLPQVDLFRMQKIAVVTFYLQIRRNRTKITLL